MRIGSLLFITLSLVGLGSVPAFAAGADGAWDCSIEDSGEPLGSLGLQGNTYVFANPNGQSGKGGVTYQDGADAPTFVVLNGVLVTEVGMLGGWLDDSIANEPQLTLIDSLGNRVDCVPRK